MADPITAHGWTVTEVHAAPGLRILHDNGSVPDVVDSARVRNERAARWQAKLDLARCIEDAATLAKVRQLAAQVIEQRNGNEAECPCCIHSAPTHADGCPLGCLLALLSEDGTP